MYFKEITLSDIKALSYMYMETFNSPPWNDHWTFETASKRLSQTLKCEDSYGILALEDEEICGMILGVEEQFFNGIMFNIREFCVKNELRTKVFGSKILNEFEGRLKDKGISEIILFTSRDDGTEGFYNKRGLQSYNGMVMMGKEL